MSALKRERQDNIKKLRNRVMKSKVHTAFKRLIEAISSKNKEEVDNRLKNYVSEVDKAVKKGIFQDRLMNLHLSTGPPVLNPYNVLLDILRARQSNHRSL